MKRFLKAIKIQNAYSFETCLSLFIMLGKTGKLVVLWGEYYILLEGNVLLYILDTVVNNQNIIFQGSAGVNKYRVKR